MLMKQQLEAISIAERIRSLMGTDTEALFADRLRIPAHLIAVSLQGRVPDPSTLARISEICGVPLEWLLRGASRDEQSPVEPVENKTPEIRARNVPPPASLVVNHTALEGVRGFVSNQLLVDIAREEIQRWIKKPDAGKDAVAGIASRTAARARTLTLPRRNYINATGIIIHTGWGNAPLHLEARERLTAATGPSPTGAAEALPRMETCARLLRALTRAEAATVTTSNAASVLLVAGALAAGREIVVAARDLVEISEGARISDILQAVGARIVSVGSANCVYLADYERAITDQTAMLLRVRVSNMATSGYIAHVSGDPLAELAHRHSLVFVDNLGGGSLVDLTKRGIPECPTLRQGIIDDADLVLASGDKIIGGPQAGIVVGKKDCINRISHHVLARTCRPAKLTLAALEATLSIYVAGRAWDEMPALRLLRTPEKELSNRANAIGKALSNAGIKATVAPDATECGGAVLPGVAFPTWTIQIKHPRLTEDQLYDVLMARGVVARRAQGRVILDLRSVLPEEDSLLQHAVAGSGEPFV
jgi:L-seryl-tRNA(Ser) seleniumtransferase